jgi:hypothetical protein
MGVGGEQALILDERRLDFRILGEQREIGGAEPFGRLALGEQIVVYAVFAHDPRRFLRDRASQFLRPRHRFHAGLT